MYLLYMDLTLNHYSTTELLDILNITDQTISYDILDDKINMVMQNLLQDNNIKQHEDIILFLNQAKNRISKEFHLHETTRQEIIHTPQNTINSLHIEKRKLLININSLFRQHYNEPSSDFLIELPNPIQDVVQLNVINVEMPSTIYTFSDVLGTNEFSIQTYDISINHLGLEVKQNEQIHTIVIPNGNYDIHTLVSYLNTTFQDISGSPLLRINVYYEAIPNKLFFRLDPSYQMIYPSAQFDLDFRIQTNLNRPIQLNMGWILGYRQPQYSFQNNYIDLSNTTINTYNGFNPESCIAINGSNYLFLHIDDFNNTKSTTIECPLQESLLSSSEIICKIQKKYDSDNTILDSDFMYSIPRVYYGPVSIKKLRIKLIDEYGRIVDLCNQNFSFLLETTLLYSSPYKEN